MEDNKMFELLTKMYAEMQNGFSGVNSRLDKVELRLDKLELKVDNLETKVDNLETKLEQNTAMLEQSNYNIKLLAEGHQNIIEQMDIKFSELENTIVENYSLHDRAIKELAKSSGKGEEAFKYVQKIKQSLTD